MQRRTIGGAESHNLVELCPSFNDKVWTFLVFLEGAGYFHSAGKRKEVGILGFGISEHLIFMELLPDHLALNTGGKLILASQLAIHG